MPRGGKRTGAPGKSYANRTDMTMPNVASGQTYGKRAEQQAAQRALPVGPPPASQAPPPPASGGGPGGGGLAALLGGGGGGALPGEVTRLDAPTERPGEPVTAGVPMGPGPGIEALGPLGLAGSEEDAVLALRAAYSAYPSEELRQILELIDL